jgi:N-methylhydantoinase A
VLSAFGSSVAEICHLQEQWPFLDLASEGADAAVGAIVESELRQVRRDLEGERLDVEAARFECEVTVARNGQMERYELPADPDQVVAALSDGVVERVLVRGLSSVPRYEPTPEPSQPHAAQAAGSREIAGHEGEVLIWEDQTPGATATGPALLESETNTCTIPAGWNVQLDGYGNALLERAPDQEAH